MDYLMQAKVFLQRAKDEAGIEVKQSHIGMAIEMLENAIEEAEHSSTKETEQPRHGPAAPKHCTMPSRRLAAGHWHLRAVAEG